MKRTAVAVWYGSGKDGNGDLTTQSKVLKKTKYSFNSRFAEGTGTNPEELLAAAHAGCFTMKLSFALDEAGFREKTIETTCYISFINGSITESNMVVKAKVTGITKEIFDASVKDAELHCPVSRALNAKITVESSFENK
ncbi:MAG: osmotically inducible protein [Segetibacter sp.]|nr:osmotically inducible protein [Segetibacter sp.]